MYRFQWLSSLVFGLALAGCGNDPLSGTWVNTSSSTVATVVSTTNKLEFQSGKKVTYTVTTVYTNSELPPLAGCTTVGVFSGTYAETTSNSSVTLTYSSAVGSATGCLDSTQDNSNTTLPSAALTDHDGTYTYGVVGSTLTLTTAAPATSLTYKKQ